MGWSVLREINTGFGQYSTEVYNTLVFITDFYIWAEDHWTKQLCWFLNSWTLWQWIQVHQFYRSSVCNNIICDAGLDHLVWSSVAFPSSWGAKGATKSYNFSPGQATHSALKPQATVLVGEHWQAFARTWLEIRILCSIMSILIATWSLAKKSAWSEEIFKTQMGNITWNVLCHLL